jgi:hypothetical protein
MLDSKQILALIVHIDIMYPRNDIEDEKEY